MPAYPPFLRHLGLLAAAAAATVWFVATPLCAQTSTSPNTQSAASPNATAQGGSQSSSQIGVTGESGADPLAVPTTSSLFNPYAGSVLVEAPQPQMLILSLEDALRLGLENNLGLVYARQSEDNQRALRLNVLNVLLPNITLHGEHALHQFNLESFGFRPSLLGQLGPVLNELGGSAALSSFPLVVKVNSSTGQANVSQYLFNWAGYDAVRALDHSQKGAAANSANARAQVVLSVGTAYLRAVAEQAQVENAQALLKQDETVLYQTAERYKAGVVANLDELRARVNYQTQEQALIEAQNNLGKAKIALNRSIGLAPGQEIELAEAQPYADLHVNTLEEARTEALANREDYLSLEEQVQAAEYERKAAVHERLPTVSFNGNYGVTSVVGLVTHGTWAATGEVDVPIFQEAKFRSDRDQYEFQLEQARAHLSDLRAAIDQQLRDSLIDVRTAEELVTVAKSNQDLARTTLDQAAQRFQAGIEDNLPVIEAAATTAQALTQYATAVFQLNQARLTLARNLGLIDTAYRPEIAGGRPAMLASRR